MKCENCGAPMRPDVLRGIYICEYCGGELVPPPEADHVLVVGETAHRCPICSRCLSAGFLETYSVEHCAGCHGMLIAMSIFVEMVETLRVRRGRLSWRTDPRNLLDGDRHLKCPSCGSQMDGHPYAGGGNVNIDTCENCGLLWLDDGELQRIVAVPGHKSVYDESAATG